MILIKIKTNKMKKIFIPTILLTVSLLFIFSCDRKKVSSTTKSNKSEIECYKKQVVKTEHHHTESCPCGARFKETSSTNSTIDSADDQKIEQEVNKFSDKLKLDSLTLEEQEEYIKSIIETMTLQEAVRHSRIFRGRYTNLGIKLAKQLLLNAQTESEKATAMGLLGVFLSDKARYTGKYRPGEPKYEEAKDLLENAINLMKKQFPNHNELHYSMNSVLISLNIFYLQSEANIDKSLKITDEYFELINKNDKNSEQIKQQEESVNYLFDNIFQILKNRKKIKLNQENFNRIYNFINSIKDDNIPYKNKEQSLEEFKKETLDVLNYYKKEEYGK